jgi:hypothetical protein
LLCIYWAQTVGNGHGHLVCAAPCVYGADARRAPPAPLCIAACVPSRLERSAPPLAPRTDPGHRIIRLGLRRDRVPSLLSFVDSTRLEKRLSPRRPSTFSPIRDNPYIPTSQKGCAPVESFQVSQVRTSRSGADSGPDSYSIPRITFRHRILIMMTVTPPAGAGVHAPHPHERRHRGAAAKRAPQPTAGAVGGRAHAAAVPLLAFGANCHGPRLIRDKLSRTAKRATASGRCVTPRP